MRRVRRALIRESRGARVAGVPDFGIPAMQAGKFEEDL